jgi:hypothetical protein
MQKWKKWLLKLNVKKCKIMLFARDLAYTVDYKIEDNQNQISQLRDDHITDLGVVLDGSLNFETNLYEKVNKSFSMLGVIKRNFKHANKETFILLYIKSMVRSHIDYCSSVWAPYMQKDIIELESPENGNQAYPWLRKIELH